MPSESKSQQRLMGACAHGAGWASCPRMPRDKMLEFARTPHKGLPERVGKNYARGTASVTLGNETPLPKSEYGTDIVPAALTPDEMILTPKQQSAVMPIPGKERKLKPSQIKKLHAMRRKDPMRLPLPRIAFRFGGQVPDRMGRGWMPTKIGRDINYQDALDPHPNFWFNPTIGNGPFGNPDPNVSINHPFGGAEAANEAGLEPRNFNYFTGVGNPFAGGFNPFNTFGYQPPAGTPGFTQGPTPNQTWFDPQGFPYGQPVTSDNPVPISLHTPPKQRS